MCLRIFKPYHFLWSFSFLNNFLQEGSLFHVLSLGVNSQRCQIAQQVALKIIHSWKVTGINFCISYCLWLSFLGYLLFHGSCWAVLSLLTVMPWHEWPWLSSGRQQEIVPPSFLLLQSTAFRLMCTLSCHSTQYHILVSAMVSALLLFGATKLC